MKYEPGWKWQPDKCPADQHFVDWIVYNHFFDKSILHIGTGEHHFVGESLCPRHSVLGVTLSPDEVHSYIQLISDNHKLYANYKLLFSDAYLLDPHLLPQFDIITLFHLAEINHGNGYTDAELLEMLGGKLNKGGYVLGYTKSVKADVSISLLDKYFVRVEEYKSLQVYM